MLGKSLYSECMNGTSEAEYAQQRVEWTHRSDETQQSVLVGLLRNTDSTKWELSGLIGRALRSTGESLGRSSMPGVHFRVSDLDRLLTKEERRTLQCHTFVLQGLLGITVDVRGKLFRGENTIPTHPRRFLEELGFQAVSDNPQDEDVIAYGSQFVLPTEIFHHFGWMKNGLVHSKLGSCVVVEHGIPDLMSYGEEVMFFRRTTENPSSTRSHLSAPLPAPGSS
jgi:hypothetical protein